MCCGGKKTTCTRFRGGLATEAQDLVSLLVSPFCVTHPPAAPSAQPLTEQLGFGQAKDTDGRCWGAWPKGSLLLDAHPLPTTSLHHDHPTDYPMASGSSTGTELCRTHRGRALSARAVTESSRSGRPRPTPPFVFLLLPSLCVC